MRHAALLVLSACFFFACVGDLDAPDGPGAGGAVADEDALRLAADVSEHIVWFGQQEVRAGKLKSALGREPGRGEHVTLRFFAPEVARFVEGAYALATGAHLFVRLRGDADFFEAPGMSVGTYYQRGTGVSWSADFGDIDGEVPGDADRIEVYAYFDRTSWNGGSCYLGYDMNECPDQIAIAGDWVSNYGRNFSIAVE